MEVRAQGRDGGSRLSQAARHSVQRDRVDDTHMTQYNLIYKSIQFVPMGYLTIVCEPLLFNQLFASNPRQCKYKLCSVAIRIWTSVIVTHVYNAIQNNACNNL
jgi:hypothetical protein